MERVHILSPSTDLVRFKGIKALHQLSSNGKDFFRETDAPTNKLTI